MRWNRALATAAMATALLLNGCAGWQSALNPHSGEARSLEQVFWLFTAVCAVIWLLVVAALLISLVRGGDKDDGPERDTPDQHRRKTAVVGVLTAATAVILAVFTIASFQATRGFMGSDPKALQIKVTGLQWWWEIEYDDPDPAKVFTTANEIHIPAGRPVTLDLAATDVIHSFWVPNLMGKQDLIPGRQNSLTFTAERPGVYRGQCAEFCGLQHAHMAFLVVADPADKFEAWRQRQLQSATSPTDALRTRGQQVFVNGPCASCHTITGSNAGGRTGPDLTHFGGRATIAAGFLLNTPENLSRWIADPQGLKPGNNMPQIPLSEAERTAVVAYLEGLK